MMRRLVCVVCISACKPWAIEYKVGGKNEVASTTETMLSLPEESAVPIEDRCAITCDRSKPAWDVVQE